MAKNINLINIFFFILIFPVLAFLIGDYLAYSYASGRSMPKASFTAPAPQAPPLIGSYAPVVEMPLFPSVSRKFQPVHISDDILSDVDVSSALRSMRLIGTFVGKKSYVVIEKKGKGAEKTFRVGESVFGVGVLREVRRNSAVISVGAMDFTIAMPKEDAVGVRAAPQAVKAGPAAAGSAAPRFDRSVRKTGRNSWAIDRKAITHALDNIGQVLSDARMKPVVSNGVVQGFVLDEVVPRGIFDIIGLKNGDILKRVNGFALTTPEKAVQVLTGLRGETEIAIDIVRGGKKIKLQYDIR
ncbi:MAG: hypothetical protein ACE5GY_03330 [Thermodesulfobacteriota bacterium]